MIINGKSKENTQMLEKVNNARISEDAAKVVQELEQIIRIKKRHNMVDLRSRTNISEV